MPHNFEDIVFEKVRLTMAKREEVITAFIAKYGCQPDEIVLCECPSKGEFWVRKKNEWISVKDRLPEHGQQCLIYRKQVNIIGMDGKPERFDCANFYKGEIKPNGPWSFCDVGFGNNQYPWAWKNGAMQYDSQDVDYWMPLPPPPESKE